MYNVLHGVTDRPRIQYYIEGSQIPVYKHAIQERSKKAGNAAVKLQVTADTKRYGIERVDWKRTMSHFLELERQGKQILCPGVVARKVADNDPRGSLRGQMGLYVKHGWRLPRHTVLGPYIGTILEEGNLGIMNLPERLERERYTYTFGQLAPRVEKAAARTSGSKSDDEAGPDAADVLPEVLTLISDGMMEGNLLRTINDFRDDPIRQPHGSTRDRTKNCMFVEVHHHGWPYVFVVLTKELVGGDEVLIDYGQAYWEGHEQRDKRLTFCESVKSQIEKIQVSIDAGLREPISEKVQRQRYPHKKKRRILQGDLLLASA